MPFDVRPQLLAIAPVAHGSALDAELLGVGLDPGAVIDFSVSTNPLGPPPEALAALAGLGRAEVWRYPDPTAGPLRRALAAGLNVDPEAVVAGNGSAELIWSLALAGARPAPDVVLIAGPTFGEYSRASRLLGAAVEEERAAAEADFCLDVPAFAGRIRRLAPRLVWLCNPNNPTGSYLHREDVAALLDASIAAGSLLVVDQAYLPFVDGATPGDLLDLLDTGHLFLLRSMTKDFGLAGLRLGYGLTTPGLAAAIRLTQPPWSISAPAQVAGLAALAATGHLDRSRAVVQAASAILVAGLQALGLRVTPPAANFVLVDVGPAMPGGAGAFRTALLGQGCVVRDCASFGLPQHVRIGVRTVTECERLLAAIGSVLGGTTVQPRRNAPAREPDGPAAAPVG